MNPRLWTHNEVPDVICVLEDDADDEMEVITMELSLLPVYLRALESGGLPLHCALLERDGKGVLLPAPGGTGKSTCSRRIPPPWRALCDDLSLVIAEGKGTYRAHSFPTWSDYLWKRAETTWDAQRHLPLSAIFFLEQGTTDEAIPLSRGQAAVRITESAEQISHLFWRHLDREERRQLKKTIFDNACRFAQAVPAFHLSATLNGRFWEEMERMLKGAG